MAVTEAAKTAEVSKGFFSKLMPYVPNLIFIIVICIIMFSAHRVTDWVYKQLARRFGIVSETSKLLIKTGIQIIGSVLILLNIPGIKSEIAKFAGLIFGGIVAFSSSTIIANGMSGILIKLIKKIKINDVIEFDNQLGRVTEIKAFHTEIETPKRKLLIIPNHVFISDKFTNLSEVGSLVSARIGLGYDVARTTVEKIMLKAARTVGIEKAFVSVVELGDFAITYELNGILQDVGTITAATSQVHKEFLDEFSKADIEIMSPHFTNVRQLAKGEKFIAKYTAEETTEELKAAAKGIEHMIFEKAERAEKEEQEKEKITADVQKLIKQQENLTNAMKKVKDDYLKKKMEARHDMLQKQIDALSVKMEKEEEKEEKEDEQRVEEK
jgi:small conductance mechanosensitive channel